MRRLALRVSRRSRLGRTRDDRHPGKYRASRPDSAAPARECAESVAAPVQSPRTCSRHSRASAPLPRASKASPGAHRCSTWRRCCRCTSSASRCSRSAPSRFAAPTTSSRSLTEAERSRGVITYSSGNHGQAVAFAAQRFGVPAVIVMPETAPAVKVDGARRWGAEVQFAGTTTVHRQARAEVARGRARAAHRAALRFPADHRGAGHGRPRTGGAGSRRADGRGARRWRRADCGCGRGRQAERPVDSRHRRGTRGCGEDVAVARCGHAASRCPRSRASPTA